MARAPGPRLFVRALANNNPDLKSFHFPPQSAIQLVMGPPNSLNFSGAPMISQVGIFIDIR